MSILEENEKRLGAAGKSPVPALRFTQLIREVARKYATQAVILIDEYDKPILDNIASMEMAREARDTLRDFYSSIKSNDEHIRFTFLTGVTKFSRVSIFSGLNIEDISLAPEFATVCGYTQHDLETVFEKHLQGVDMDKEIYQIVRNIPPKD